MGNSPVPVTGHVFPMAEIGHRAHFKPLLLPCLLTADWLEQITWSRFAHLKVVAGGLCYRGVKN